MQIWNWWERRSSSKGNQEEDKKLVVHLRKIHFKIFHPPKLILELSIFTVAELVILLETAIRKRMMKTNIDTRGIQGISLVKIRIMILNYLFLMLIFMLRPMRLELGLWILEHPLIWHVINIGMKILRRPTMVLTSTWEMP